MWGVAGFLYQGITFGLSAIRASPRAAERSGWPGISGRVRGCELESVSLLPALGRLSLTLTFSSV